MTDPATTRQRKPGGKRPSNRAQNDAPDWFSRPINREAFVELVVTQGEELFRDLPWRNIDDPYAVLVSEVMLQQTQVSRVMRYWEKWMALFPTVDALASADTATVLDMWQGLGYNRRALALKRACEECSARYAGTLPDSIDELIALPGVGPATAAGVMAFAFDRPAVYIETNVRSVFLHELFPGEEGVSDKRIVPYVADCCPTNGVRAWYYALLDYGAHLKKLVANPSRRSGHYARQSAFAGSRREKRSFVLKQVLSAREGITAGEVLKLLNDYECRAGRDTVDAQLFESVLDELESEGFFHREGEFLVP